MSTNKWKYSETFIQTHFRELWDEVLILSNGYYPKEYSIDRGETFHSIDVPLEQFLKDHEIKLVLAEYGPAGVEVLPHIESLDLPMLIHFHGYDAFRFDVLDHYRNGYLRMFEKAKALIVVSKDMKKQLIDLGCPEEKISLIPYGIDIDRFCPSSQTNSKIILFVGRFVEKKNPLECIRLFAKMRELDDDYKLIMIGDGELLNHSKQYAAELGVFDQIEFKGVLSQEDAIKEYQKAEMLFITSSSTNTGDSEGLPNVLLEGMASGLIVFANAHAGINDVIENGKNGFFIDSSNPARSSRDISQILKEKDLRSIKNAAVETISNYYYKDRYISDLNKLIAKFI